MKIQDTRIKDLKVIIIKKIKDSRGFFSRNFCEKELKLVTKRKIVQSNISFNKKKFTLRGFHYQKSPSKEGKFITCLKGKIFNVTIDLNKKSKSYLKLFKIIINSDDNKIIYIPPGCANAYLTLEKNTLINYLMTDFYKPESYKKFNYKSKEIKINWPAKPVVISPQDQNAKNLF